MDDQRIEEMLHESWSPKPPDGLRERVLARMAEEPTRKPIISRWKLALLGIGVAVVILTNVSDYARDVRLTALSSECIPLARSTFAAEQKRLCELSRELDRIQSMQDGKAQPGDDRRQPL